MKMASFAALGATGLAVMVALQAGAPASISSGSVPSIEQVETAVAIADAQAAAVNGPRR